MHILVTGASGFIGSTLVPTLMKSGDHTVRVCSRKTQHYPNNNLRNIEHFFGELSPDYDWHDVIKNCDIIIHLAGRVHQIHDNSSDPLKEFRQVNVNGTLSLAKQAAEVGVKRFIFLSSIGVNGDQSSNPFKEEDTPDPQEPYAISKLEAEIGLQQIAARTNMDVVIVRAPLVYGPNAPGNFGRLVNIVKHGIPLPLGAIDNKRSLIGVDNLVDLIETCLYHPLAINQTFLAADGEDVSTTELLRRLGVAFGCPTLLIPIPHSLIEKGASLFGKHKLARSLCASLQINIEKSRSVLGWHPPLDLGEGLRRVAAHRNG